ncbi:hypothetical protein [Bradyrhizobium genosp. P]|uniref:hypothetical protein n=1 Tax=Bradyrhizobium genosp. P TaxID=83641 RepID=UPI003CF809C2
MDGNRDYRGFRRGGARSNSKIGHVEIEIENEVPTSRLDRAAKSSARDHAMKLPVKPNASAFWLEQASGHLQDSKSANRAPSEVDHGQIQLTKSE